MLLNNAGKRSGLHDAILERVTARPRTELELDVSPSEEAAQPR